MHPPVSAAGGDSAGSRGFDGFSGSASCNGPADSDGLGGGAGFSCGCSAGSAGSDGGSDDS